MKASIYLFQLISFLSLFLLSINTSHAAVIFETTFDLNADWNASRQYQGAECVDPCTTAPTEWTNYRVVDGSGTWSNPTGSIRVLPAGQTDHTTSSTAGKAYVVYNQSHPVDNWPGDSELMRKLNADYEEVYLRLWLKTQSNWQSVAGASSKVFRIQHYDGSGNIFANFSDGTNAPIALILLGQMGSSVNYPNTAAFIPAMRCDPQSTYYYCNASPAWMQNDIANYMDTSTHPTILKSWGDGNWHRWDLHLKMNTVGSNNGIFEMWIDGNQLISKTDAQWRSSGSSASVGWNLLSIGGNSNNSFATQADQWYAIDDIVISTTQILGDYVIGNNTVTDTAQPSSPIGLSVI